MRTHVIALLGLAACAGCSPAAAPINAPNAAANRAPSADPGLPFAANVEPLLDEAPLIVVDADHVLVDGAVVGDVHAVETGGRLLRIDGEFDALRAKREVWKAAHPGAAYPGVASLEVPRTAKALVVKSVFQTAAFSGHPNLAFVVQTSDTPPRLARIKVDPHVPGPPGTASVGAAPAGERRLVVRLVPGSPVRLTWKVGATVVAVTELPWDEAFAREGDNVRAPALASRFQKEWGARAEHPDPSDKHHDRALIEVDNSAELRDVIAVLDALYQVKRGGAPAFDVTLSMHMTDAEAPSLGEPIPAQTGPVDGSGRLAAEVIRRIVRGEFARFRRCYEAGLGRNAKLSGKVSVKFTIDLRGKVVDATDAASDLQDPAVVKCVVDGFSKLAFPAPDGGVVKVVYPIVFKPEDDALPAH